ncbi:MAG: FMN-binding glutamate synthase family protein [Actinomycetota bacterium]
MAVAVRCGENGAHTAARAGGPPIPGWLIAVIVVLGLLALVTVYDLAQRRHAVLRNFPIIGHLRYLLESFGPELRQYIVTGNDDERPFSRNQRSWIYRSSKRLDNHFGFGTDNDVERTRDYLILKHAAFPHPPPPGGDPPGSPLPCAKVMGAARGRRHAFRPASVVNVSGMSFGALSGAAVRALNAGARLAGCLHNTGEGGLSVHHRQGGDLVFQIGTAYFGCRDASGRFSLPRLVELCGGAPVRAIEVKLSQGAKPGVGGFLPARKVSAEIAQARGVPAGRDVVSPPSHSAFSDVDSLLEFVETVADATGLPVGIKSAVGESDFWMELASRMAETGRGVDFITVDGGEGGTGAAPLVFADHVALPFRLGVTRVFREFAMRGLDDGVVFIGSGKLGLPETGLLAFALGCDMVNVGREAMMAVGCIQAQRCHTGRCPTGVATQSAWLQRGLDPQLKSVRLANYVEVLRGELLALARTCGHPHPTFVTAEHFEFVTGPATTTAMERFHYRPGWTLPSAEDQEAIRVIMAAGGVAVGA